MEKTKNGEKLAFPCDGNYAGEARSNNDAGLTKREYFAAMAMQGLLAHETDQSKHDPRSAQLFAAQAVMMSDALLIELEKSTLTRPADSEGV
jgi:hypothetical protein